MQTVITAKETSERKGIVTKPNHSIYLVVHEMPNTQGATLSGIIL